MRARDCVSMATMNVMGRMFRCLLICLLLTGSALLAQSKTTYNMDDSRDCSLAGHIDIATSTKIYVNAKQSSVSNGPQSCRLDFRADDDHRLILVEFGEFYFASGQNGCPVQLYMYYGTATAPSETYGCSSARPAAVYTKARTLTVRLDRIRIDSQEYNFQIILSTYSQSSNAGNISNNSPVGAGVIVGIVAGIIVFLVIMVIVLCCCCNRNKRPQRNSDEEVKMRLEDERSTASLGYTNESAKNGGLHSGYDSEPKQKVTAFDGPQSPRTLTLSQYKDFDSSPTRNNAFKYDPAKHPEYNEETRSEPDDVPQSPLLLAIRSSARQKSTYRDSEAEAEERSKRFSKSSSAPSSPDKPPTPLPSLPVLPRETLLRSPQKPPGPKQASIRRAPRPASSNEELAQMGKPHDVYGGDENIQIIPDSPLEKSQPGGVVAIQVNDPHSPLPRRHWEFANTAEDYYDDEELEKLEEELRSPNNTQHTLRPNRKRSPGAQKRKPPNGGGQPEAGGPPNQNKKQQQNKSHQQTQPLRPLYQLKSQHDQHQPVRKEPPASKRAQKSPRLGSLRKPKGSTSSHLDDDLPARPGTPTSVASRAIRTDDLSEFSPLQRTDSRQSLYASRSSLYGRRGKRRGSFSESVVSYAHDDIDVYRHRRQDSGDYDERPITDRDRGFKSLGDIHYGGSGREKSTQTLRETATQTGAGNVTHSKPRKVSHKKSPKTKRAISTSGTQTKKDQTVHGEAKTKAPRYQKATTKVPKVSQGVDTGVGLDDFVSDQQREHTEEIVEPAPVRNESVPQRPRTPVNYQGQNVQGRAGTTENSRQQRARTPDNSLYQQDMSARAGTPTRTRTPEDDLRGEYHPSAPSPVPSSVPAAHAPPVPQDYLPPTSAYSKQDPSENVYMQMFTPPPQNPAMQHSDQPYAPSPPPSAKPTKSPWEILCDLTDAEYHTRGPGSGGGSVHSGGHKPGQPFHPGFTAPDRYDHNLPPDGPGPPGYTPGRAMTPGYTHVSNQYDERPDSAQSEPHRYNEMQAPTQPNMYPKKSSWEQLKQITDTEYKLTYGASTYEHSESNV